MLSTKRKLSLAIAGTLGVALALLYLGAAQPAAHAAEQTSPVAGHAQIDRQVDEAPPLEPGSSNPVPVQVWTIMAAGGACAVFLLLFLLRAALGRVHVPPPQEEAAHH